ncbi:MAG: hypothetical protein B7Y76_15150, partial [Sphingobacteriia bacterium 35-40-5]
MVSSISAQEEVIYNNEFDTYGTFGSNVLCKSEIKNGKLYLNSNRALLAASNSTVKQEIIINTKRNFKIETSIAIEYLGESKYFGLIIFGPSGSG